MSKFIWWGCGSDCMTKPKAAPNMEILTSCECVVPNFLLSISHLESIGVMDSVQNSVDVFAVRYDSF